MRLIAIDPGTHTGAVLKERNAPFTDAGTWTVTLDRDLPRPEALANYQRMIANILEIDRPDVAVVEGYSMASRGNALTKMAELGGVVRAACGMFGVPVVEVPPPTWKSVTFRAKKATKAERKAYLAKTYELLGIQVFTTDIADAALMLYAVDVAGDPTRKSPGIVSIREQFAAIDAAKTIV